MIDHIEAQGALHTVQCMKCKEEKNCITGVGMMKNMLLFVIILFGTFGYRGSGMALEIKVDKAGSISNRVMSGEGIIDQTSESEDLKEIEEQLKQMLEEMKRLERELQEKFQKELLPIIRQELERLKRWLRDLQHEDEEKKPQKVMIK